MSGGIFTWATCYHVENMAGDRAYNMTLSFMVTLILFGSSALAHYDGSLVDYYIHCHIVYNTQYH